MGKASKRTIKFLRKQTKTGANGAAPQRKKGKTGGQKRPRSDEDDMEVVDLGVENGVKPKGLPNSVGAAKRSGGSIKKHRDELEDLKKQDPDFYKYLQQNDSNLLSFGEGEEEDDEDVDFGEDEMDRDDEDEEDEGEGGKDDINGEDGKGTRARRKASSTETVDVTEEILNETIKRATEGSLFAVKKLLSIFKAACSPSSAAQEDGDEEEGSPGTFTITSPEVYQQVMVGVADNAHIALYKLLEVDTLSSEILKTMNKRPKWKKVQFLVLSFFRSVLHTLASLAASAKQGGEVAVFLMTSLEAYIPLLSPLPRLAKAVLNSLLNIWSHGPPPAEDEANVRVHAFLRIRQMALALPGNIPEECFRSIYLKFARECKTFNEANAASVNFMAKCIAELYSSDPVQSYQQAFLYIRQLALHLRTAFLKKTSEATRQVTTWQFLNCVRLWTRIVCAMPGPDALGPLSFPLAQVILGIIVTAPSSYSMPLRFHLIACLHQLAAGTKSFIPTAARLLEILENPDIFSKPVASTEAPPKLQYLVKLPPDSVNRVAVRDLLIQETINLLRNEAEIYRYHVGLPEYLYVIVRKLRAFVKKAKVSKWRDLARALIGQLEQQGATVKSQRMKLGKAPMDIKEFEPLLPPGQPDSAARLGKLMAVKITSSPSEVHIDLSNKNTAKNGNKAAAGKKKGAAADMSDEDEEDDEDDDDEDDDEADDDEEEEEEEEEVKEVVRPSKRANKGSVDKLQDKVDTFEWSDDEN